MSQIVNLYVPENNYFTHRAIGSDSSEILTSNNYQVDALIKDFDLLISGGVGLGLEKKVWELFSFYREIVNSNSHLNLSFCPLAAFQREVQHISSSNNDSSKPSVLIHSLYFDGVKGLREENPLSFYRLYKRFFEDSDLTENRRDCFYTIINTLTSCMSKYNKDLINNKLEDCQQYVSKYYDSLTPPNSVLELEELLVA